MSFRAREMRETGAHHFAPPASRGRLDTGLDTGLPPPPAEELARFQHSVLEIISFNGILMGLETSGA